MELALPFGSKKVAFDVPYSPDQLAIARRRPLPAPCDWEEAAVRATAAPIAGEPLAGMRLTRKKVVILADTGRDELPAGTVLPVVIDLLKQAGARDADIAVVATCGDDPMTPAEMQRWLGPDIVGQYACTCHDPFSSDHRFCGFSALGTPIFVNKLVAEADFRIAAGLVRPHVSRGYAGGDDAVLPGVCSFETIARHSALSFASNSSYGHLGNNPSRLDTENVGMTVGLDYVVNYTVTLAGAPIAAFAGQPVRAQRAAVNSGDRMAWAAQLGGLADVAIGSPGHDWTGDRPFDPVAIDFIAAGVNLGGSIIFLASPGMLADPEDEHEQELREVPIRELARMHEKRDWACSVGEIAAKLRAVQRSYFARRPFFYRSVILVGSDLPAGELDRLGAQQTETIQEAVEMVTARHRPDARVALVPEAATTLCLPEFH